MNYKSYLLQDEMIKEETKSQRYLPWKSKVILKAISHRCRFVVASRHMAITFFNFVINSRCLIHHPLANFGAFLVIIKNRVFFFNSLTRIARFFAIFSWKSRVFSRSSYYNIFFPRSFDKNRVFQLFFNARCVVLAILWRKSHFSVIVWQDSWSFCDFFDEICDISKLFRVILKFLLENKYWWRLDYMGLGATGFFKIWESATVLFGQ